MSTQNASGSSFSSVLSTLEAHRHALTVLLPSSGAIQLQKHLYFRLRDLARVMTAPSTDSMGASESEFQEQLWLWAKGSGLTVLLLNASILTASLDKEGPTAAKLITCINLILASGALSHRSHRHHNMDDVEIIKA